MVGLLGFYILILVVSSRGVTLFSTRLGAILPTGVLVALYGLGSSSLPVLGRGMGQLAAVTFLGVSLVVAGVRAVPGCELMATPGVFFRKQTELACFIFSPLDNLERKLRRKRDV